MPTYQHLLLATDLSAASDAAAERAKELVGFYKAKLTVINVVDYVPPAYVGVELPRELASEEYLVGRAQGMLKEWLARHDLDGAQVQVAAGQPTHAIVDAAKAAAADLIVLGSHGAHGLDLLLGSTANGVLHRAPCDVLAVRARR